MKHWRLWSACLLTAMVWTMPGTAENSDPHVTHIGRVAPDVLGVTIEAQRRVPGVQTPYVAQPGDEIADGQHRWLKRGGREIGTIAGREGKIFYPFDDIAGEPLDESWADRAGSYSLVSEGGAVEVTGVSRKTKPTDEARLGTWSFAYPKRHTVYLKLSEPLQEGKAYTLRFNGHDPAIDPATFTVDDEALRSEAVRVSHLGFRPDDPDKVAYLSLWTGDGGPMDYAAGMPFRVVNAAGETVYEGRTELSLSKDQTEAGRGRNYNEVDVYRMDFSALDEPGEYRVVVDGVGCSYPFPVAEGVWEEAYKVSMLGLLHHRSGVALGPPVTDYVRPVTMMPGADGFKVYASRTGLQPKPGEPGGQKGAFERLVANRTDIPVPEAWGGYMDAGDWDRRAQHLYVSRLLLEQYELNPEYFGELALRVPADEAGNHLPDVIDEALFNLDHYRRMQRPDGGVRGGVESSDHPRYGEASWQESLDVFAFEPDPYASYHYAATAARAARVLDTLDPALASTYQQSAARAFDWAEQAVKQPGWDPQHYLNRDGRGLAAIELYKLTGEPRYHDAFLATTQFTDPNAGLQAWKKHHQREHAFAYATVNDRPTDEAVQTNARNALLRDADQRAAMTKQTGFGWTNDPYGWAGWGQQTAMGNSLSLVRAHALTGDETYLAAILRGSQFGAGANPSNLVYTTGLGHDSPRYPLHTDSRITNQPAPAGITIYGPLDERAHGDDKPLYWGTKKMVEADAIYPDIRSWPPLECHWDIKMHPAVCEYTVQQTIGPNAYVWGYLAARR